MKKFLSLLALLVFVLVVSAQSTSPRFGTLKSQDNTGRTLSYGYVTATDAAGFDSIKVTPKNYETIYNLTISTDSLRFGSPVLTQSYAGDIIKIIISSGSTGKKLTFKSPNIIGQGTLTSTTKGKAVIAMIFDGSKWVELYRLAQ